MLGALLSELLHTHQRLSRQLLKSLLPLNIPLLSVWSHEQSQSSEGFSCRTLWIDVFSMALNSWPGDPGAAVSSAIGAEERRNKRKRFLAAVKVQILPRVPAVTIYVHAWLSFYHPSHFHRLLNLTWLYILYKWSTFHFTLATVLFVPFIS